MESNLNGAVNGNEDPFDFPDFPADFSDEWTSNDTFAPIQDQQFFPPFDHSSSSFPPYNHQNYQDDYGNYQYHDPLPSYYAPPPVPFPCQSQPFSSQPVSQDFHQPPCSQPNQVQPHYDDYGRDYHTPTSPFRELSPTIPFRPRYREISPTIPYEDPMERMQQLTKQSYGGSLAASAAAVEAAEAAQAARRNSPPRQKKEGAEETVRDVLQRQYQEQKRQASQIQLLQSQQGHPTPPFPSSLVFSKPTQKHPSILGSSAPSLPSDSQSLEHHSTATLTSTLPTAITPKTSQALIGSPPKGDDVVSLLKSGAPLSHLPCPPSKKIDPTPIRNSDVEKNDMMSLEMHSLPLQSSKSIGIDPSKKRSATLSPSATVVQSLLSGKEDQPSSSSSSRKRPLEETKEAPLKPGPRVEINEKGEKVERVYVLVHHCNANDPEWAKDGVIMPLEEYTKQAERDDMITFSYSSVISPYEFDLTEGAPGAPPAAAAASEAAPVPPLPVEASQPLA